MGAGVGLTSGERGGGARPWPKGPRVPPPGPPSPISAASSRSEIPGDSTRFTGRGGRTRTATFGSQSRPSGKARSALGKGSAARISFGIRAGPARSRMRSPATHHRNSPPEGSSRPLLNAALRGGRQEKCGAHRYRSAPEVGAPAATADASDRHGPAMTITRLFRQSANACVLHI